MRVHQQGGPQAIVIPIRHLHRRAGAGAGAGHPLFSAQQPGRGVHPRGPGISQLRRVAAGAEAEANAKVAASLTQELIDYTKAQLWNGEMPAVMGDATPILDMTDFTSEE